MTTAVPYAADEQMRVEALRAAVAFCAGDDHGYFAPGVVEVAGIFLSWLLDEPVSMAGLHAYLEGDNNRGVSEVDDG